MRVLFDGFWWVQGPESNRAVARELLLAWASEFPGDDLLLAVPAKHGRTPADVPPGVVVVPTRLWPQAAVNVAELPVLVRRHHADVVCCFNFAPLATPAVVFVHDLMFMDHPEWFSRKERSYFKAMPWSLRWATAVTTSSRAESLRMRRLLPRVAVIEAIGLGISRELVTAVPVAPFPQAPTAFALLVGRLNVRKNLGTTLRAAQLASSIDPDRPLIVVGDDAYSGRPEDVPAELSQMVTDGSIRFLGRVPVEELSWLYRHANLTIYVPLDEGFGLPPIEARWFGCPVVTSDLAVFHETVGDVASFVDPRDERQIAAAIDQAMQHPRPSGDRPGPREKDPRWAALAHSLRRLATADR